MYELQHRQWRCKEGTEVIEVSLVGHRIIRRIQQTFLHPPAEPRNPRVWQFNTTSDFKARSTFSQQKNGVKPVRYTPYIYSHVWAGVDGIGVEVLVISLTKCQLYLRSVHVFIYLFFKVCEPEKKASKIVSPEVIRSGHNAFLTSGVVFRKWI